MSTKASVLTELEQNRVQAISGENLAQRLGVSRAAIWKAIQELRSDGYEIQSSPKVGYCLASSSDLLSLEGICLFLKDRTLSDRISVAGEVDSTNGIAKKLAMEGAPHGTTVIADRQTAGRGRRGRNFDSPSGSGIYLSMILRTGLSASDSVLITTGAAVAVARAVRQVTGTEVSIKWVNDLFFQEKKICGILSEGIADLESGGMEAVIVGIGINVRRDPEEFPEEIRDIAGALYNREEPGVTRNQLAAAVIEQVLDVAKGLEERAFLQEYRQRSFLLGKEILVLRQNGQEPSLALDIDDQGGLIIQRQDGSREILHSGEVSVRPNS